MSAPAYPTRVIYRWPFWLAMLTMLGLMFALFGDGFWDAASWVLLCVPLAVIVRKLMTRGARQPV